MKCDAFSKEEIIAKLHYEPETGVFTYLYNSGRAVVGKKAGTVNPYGYRVLHVSGKSCMAHRVAWLYVHGTFPKGEIDHIDGCKDNNRISNLRDSTHSENRRNIGKYRNNTSGYKGVTWSAAQQQWQAQCMLHKHQHHVGYSSTPEAAHEAYKAFAKVQHGEFFNGGDNNASK